MIPRTMQRMLRPLLAALLLAHAAPPLASAAPSDDWSEQIRAWNHPLAPFRMLGNLYYVGTAELASFLLATPEGLVLVDSGVEEGADQILAGIAALGFAPEDLKLIVNTQAHFDHAAGFAALKKRSGARLAAGAPDAALLARGGKDDFAMGDSGSFPPVVVDVPVEDGQPIRAGGTTLLARRTPGHTQGATTWLVSVADGGKEYRVVFAASTTINPGVRIENNPKYPGMLADFEATFATLQALPCDVFLGQHAGFFDLAGKRSRLLPGAANPFVDPAGCKAAFAGMEQRFREQLAAQR